MEESRDSPTGIPKIQTGPTPRSQRARSQRSHGLLIGMSACVAAVVLLGVVVAVYLRGGGDEASPEPVASSGGADLATADQQDAGSSRSESSDSAQGEALSNATFVEDIVDEDDGRLLWASPTQGTPLDLSYVPNATRLLLHVRINQLAAHAEGPKVRAALGPWGEQAIDKLQQLSGAKVEEIDNVLLALAPGGDASVDACLRIALKSPWSHADLSTRHPSGNDQQRGGQMVRLADQRAYFLPQSAEGKTLVVCPAGLADELIASRDDPPSLTRDVDQILQGSDALRTFTLVVDPRFLKASGAVHMRGAWSRLADAFRWLFGGDASAVLVSLNWQESFFIELRARPVVNAPPRHYALSLAKRINQSPGRMQDLVLAESWHPYGRQVVGRFPLMLREAAAQSRVGDDGRQAALRCYLPVTAGHNLLMAAELLIHRPGGASGSIIEQPASPLTTVEDRLEQTISLAFSRDSLQRALEMLAEEIGAPIDIRGSDLELEGITKNQPLQLDARDRPGREVLVEILTRANPDKLAQGPSDLRQKLVYVVAPGAGDTSGRIIVTTRAAVKKRGGRLPKEFVATEGESL